MKYHALFVIFEKKLQIIGGALLVKIMSVFGFWLFFGIQYKNDTLFLMAVWSLGKSE